MSCKNKCKSTCKKESCGKLQHKCLGVVPGTFIICGEDGFQYCSQDCLEIAGKLKINSNKSK